MCKIIIKLIGFGILIFFLGCNKKDDVHQDLIPLNSFSMNLNDQLWEPSLIGNDPCYSTFQCEWSAANDIPFYTIKAYKDPQSSTTLSENMLWIQIMNVTDTGVFYLSDPSEDFNSYALFIINKQGSQKIYESSISKTNSVVEIEEIIPIEGRFVTGIKGSFSGILYNSVDANDSIVIDNCMFTFKKVNWANYCHCAE